MDTSERYIKMCDCPEIQDQSPEKSCIGYIAAGYIIDEYRGNIFALTQKDTIWLPRQDQLQEMLTGQWDAVLNKFQNWNYIPMTEDIPIYESPEQLWIGFVMKELYNKSWNNDKECWE